MGILLPVSGKKGKGVGQGGQSDLPASAIF